jgi:hypothetical protein
LYRNPSHPLHTKNTETPHFSYFQRICAPEFTLYFSDPFWETIVLQAAYEESFIWHAVVAIGALSRYEYHPSTSGSERKGAWEFAIGQYNAVIRAFPTYGRDGVELALLGSIVFIALEVLMGGVEERSDGNKNRVEVHLTSALELLKSVRRDGGDSRNLEGLERALRGIEAQVLGFERLDDSGSVGRT